jgi:hypothetical protein
MQRLLSILIVTVLGSQLVLAGSLTATRPDENTAAPVEPVLPDDADQNPASDGSDEETGDTPVAEEPQAPLGPLPGYAAGNSYDPNYQSSGFQPVMPDGTPIFAPGFNSEFAPRPMLPDPIAPKPVETETADTENADEEPVAKTAQPSPAERPLPPHPGDQYDALLRQDRTGVRDTR